MVRDSPVHVTTQRRHYVGKDGIERVYETHLLRRSFREDGKVRNETVANLSHLPAAAITAVRSVLSGRDLVDAASVVSINRSVPHGHVAAVWGLPQIEYALLTDPAGCPVAVRVFEGNTADPTAFTAAVTAVKDTFALENMVMVGDRGMITTARIKALKEVGGLGWLTALRSPQIAVLAADTGPLQMSLFDEQNFAEITHPDYPTERLVACRNPALADLRGRNRLDLLTATEKALA